MLSSNQNDLVYRFLDKTSFITVVDDRMRNLQRSLKPRARIYRFHRYTSCHVPVGFGDSQMSHYRDKLKKLVVLGGIALALMPCLQQTHAICRLAGCVKLILPAPVEVCIVKVADRGHCCRHESTTPREKSNQDRGGEELPCGPDCWCAQPPDPREAPRNVTESAKSQLSTLHAETATAFSIERQTHLDLVESLAPDSLPSLSAGETCVLLCRFLT